MLKAFLNVPKPIYNMTVKQCEMNLKLAAILCLCKLGIFLFHIFFCTFSPGGHSNQCRMSRGYQARPKIHLIRVVFQDQALYACTSLRGAKTCKIGKKSVIWSYRQFWKGHDGQIKKNACKNAYLGSIFIHEKYVIRVLFVCPWTSLIPPLAIRVALLRLLVCYLMNLTKCRPIVVKKYSVANWNLHRPIFTYKMG